MKKLTSQSIKLFLTVLATIFILQGNAVTVTSINDGDWSATSTWEDGVVPVAGDDVIIKHTVTVDMNVSGINNITITDDASSTGNLNLAGTTFSFSINGTILIESPQGTNTSLSLLDAEVTIGDGTDDALLIQGGVSSFDNAIVNVSGYMHHTEGRLTISNTSTLNISTADVRNDSNNNYYIGPYALFKFGDIPSVKVNIKNGNTGAAEVHIEQITTGYADEFEINFEPTDVDGDDTYELVSNYGFKTVSADLGTPSSGTNTLYLKPIATDDFTPLQYNDINVDVGRVLIDRLINAQVNNNFTSTTADSIVNNGYVYVVGTLTQNSNIVGDGTVAAGTYVNNGFHVFGIPVPVNGQKYSSATWLGGTNPIWSLGSNWSQGIVPHANTSVIIKSTTTSPVMDGLGPYASAVLEIESGGSLTQNAGIGYTIGFYCILSGGILNVNGTLKVTTDLSVESGSALNINNGGDVKVGP